jgi:hypothetical protein
MKQNQTKTKKIPADWWNYPINPLLGYKEIRTKNKKTGIATGKLSLDQLKALEL